MPVEIREIVIRGTVHETAEQSVPVATIAARPAVDLAHPELAALIRRHVEAALRARSDR